MNAVEYTMMKSPIGNIRVAWSSGGLVSVSLGTELEAHEPDPAWRLVRDLKCEATDQLRAYIDGKLKEFDLPLVLNGTPFQEKVWLALADIPYGETISYGELARRIGSPKAVRAVGAANGRNPIPIVLPCHRVIGQDGSLTGYGGGLKTKAALLDFERGVRPLLAP
jgi:methylated-DNA-[protein]-cysteine S-methyltransferase